jgi:CheY-like chemotaxis protein
MLRCLVVDDSSQFLTAARGWLERQGIAVVGLASTTAQAMRQAAELRPDVVLVDIDLGSESGFELVEQLQDMAGLDSFPVILISAYAEEDYAELIAASPAVGFLPKTTLSAESIRGLVGEDARQSAQPGSATGPGGT